MAGAIYFDLCGASRSGALCAVAWGALVVAGLTVWQMLYDRQRLSTEIPFADLKRQSRVNEIANRLPYDDFGDLLRQELLAYP